MRVDLPHRAAELGCERPRGGFGGRPDELELAPDRARAALDLGQPGRTMKVAWPRTQHRRSRHSPSFVHRGGTSKPWRVFPTRGGAYAFGASAWPTLERISASENGFVRTSITTVSRPFARSRWSAKPVIKRMRSAGC